MQESCLNKVVGLQPAILIKFQMFAVTFSTFFRIVIFKNTSGRLPLKNDLNNEHVNYRPDWSKLLINIGTPLIY